MHENKLPFSNINCPTLQQQQQQQRHTPISQQHPCHRNNSNRGYHVTLQSKSSLPATTTTITPATPTTAAVEIKIIPQSVNYKLNNNNGEISIGTPEIPQIQTKIKINNYDDCTNYNNQVLNHPYTNFLCFHNNHTNYNKANINNYTTVNYLNSSSVDQTSKYNLDHNHNNN